MKKLAGLLVAACFVALTCSNDKPANRTYRFKNEYASIDFDTVYVDCDQKLGAMMLLDNTYYIFSKRIVGHLTDRTDKFYGFSKKGEKLFETDVSELFNAYYYLYPLGDKLTAVIGGRENTVYFDRSELIWKPLSKIKFPLFEDKDYYVTSSCSGEWGGTIYFEDKHTGKIYEGGSTCPVKVTKFNGKYYVSNFLGHMFGHTSLYEIDDPRNMSVYTGERPQEDRYIDQKECSSTQGIKQVANIYGYFGDTRYDSVNKVSISRSLTVELLSSFVRKKQLLHLCLHDDDLFIYKFENSDSLITEMQDSRIKNVYRFETEMNNNPWVQFSREDYQQLHLTTSREDTGIIIEITRSRIFVHYIINKHEQP